MKFYFKSFLVGLLLLLITNGTGFGQDQINVYRIYNSQSQEHLYTSNEAEKDSLIKNGWIDENIGWISASSGKPVYRLFNPELGQHLFTSDPNEIQILTTQNGWQADFNEIPIFYSNGDNPVYRLYHPGIIQHHLTTDVNEYNELKNQGWNQEGIAFYAISIGENSNLNNNNNLPETNPNDPSDNETKSNILVAYFSATNNTHHVASTIADNLEATLYRIEAKDPYTTVDLDYGDSTSRCQREQNDKTARPEIKDNLPNLNDYSVIFLGYPIWFNQEPRIIDTFIESHDFSGITIIPFCTSGSSSIENSANLIRPLAPNANWITGKRLTPNNTQEIQEWIQSIRQQLSI